MVRLRNLLAIGGLQVLLVFLTTTSALGQWHIPVIPGPGPNSAVQIAPDCFRMTTQALNTRGVVWDSVQLDLTQPFDIQVNVMLGPNAAGFGADGMAVVLQRQGLNSWGAGGNALGFAAAVPPNPSYTAISPSIAFELDTWGNQAAGVADINNNHIAIHQNGITTSAVAGPTNAIASGGSINDSICRTYRVLWNPTTNNIRIFFPDAVTLRLNTTIDLINTVFSGNSNVWWGFTAASGNPGQTSVICADANFARAGADTAVCAGETLQLNASGGTSYFWGQGFPIISNQNIPNPQFTSLIPFTYDLGLLVTNIAGCSDRDSIRVTVEPIPNAVAGSAGNICLGDSLQIGGTPDPDYSYAWSPSTQLSDPTVAQPWVVPTAPGNTNYQLIVVDTAGLAGCSDTATVAITATDTPSVSLSATPNPLCVGSPTVITATASGGTGTYTYLWSPGGATTSSITVSPTVTTTYTVTVTDQSLCSTLGTIDITVLDTPTVTASAVPPIVCAGQSTTLSANASGGTGALGYNWSSGGVSPTESVTPFSTTTYTVTVTDAAGCQGSASTTVTVNVSDSIDIMMPDTFVCNNGIISITNTFGTPGINNWTWSPTVGVSNPNIPNPLISPPTDTTYYLFGLNTLTGCGYIDSIHIDVFALDVQHFLDTTICLGDTIQFNIAPTGGSGDYSVVWLLSTPGYISDDSVANPMISPAITTVYTGLITDNVTSCQSIININVTVSPLQVQATPNSAVINPGQSVQLEAFGAMFYLWTPDTTINCPSCPNPVVAPLESITYNVLGWDTSGCQGQATVVISVDPFLVPNVFTPNGDGFNDVLFFNYHGQAFYQISVFDRWGVEIFSTTDQNAMWDGKTNGGADAPETVYYVVVRIVGDNDIPDDLKQKVFSVTLLR